LIDQRPPDRFDVEGAGEFQQPHCPQCESVDISFNELNKRVAFVSAFLGLPIPLKRKGWKCHSCGHSWRQIDDAIEHPSA
jgi:transposase-like protein